MKLTPTQAIESSRFPTRVHIRLLAASTTVALAMFGAGYVTGGSTFISIIVAVITISLLLCILLSAQHIFGLAVFCLMMSGSSVVETSNVAGIGFRIEAVLLLAGLLILRRPNAPRFHLHSKMSVPLLLFVTALWLTVMAASVPHSDWSMAANASLGALAISLLVIAPTRVLTRTQFQHSVIMVLMLFLLFSVLVATVFPSVGFQATRMRGLTENANLLGFYILLTVTVSILVEQRKRMILLVLAVTFPSLILTGSRTSVIALLVVMALGVMGRTGYMSAVARFMPLIFVAFLFWGRESPTGVASLLRTDNSRSPSWEEAVWVYRHSPLFGVGLGKGDVEVASSPLRAFVAGGSVGLAFLIFGCALLLIASWRLGWGSFTLTVGALTHSLGESWLVSLTGPMVQMFVLTWITVSANEIHITSVSHSKRSYPGTETQQGLT